MTTYPAGPGTEPEGAPQDGGLRRNGSSDRNGGSERNGRNGTRGRHTAASASTVEASGRFPSGWPPPAPAQPGRGPGRRGNGHDPNGARRNGTAVPDDDALERTAPQGPPVPPPGRRAPNGRPVPPGPAQTRDRLVPQGGEPRAPRMPGGRRPAVPDPDDRPTDVVPPVQDEPATSRRIRGDDLAAGRSGSAGAAVRGSSPSRTDTRDSVVEPQRRVDPDSAGVEGSGGVPGRHRRRAGASLNGRPASAYVATKSAGSRKPRPGRRRKSTFWKELPLLIVVALVLTFLIQTFLAKVYVIPSGSMETTLHGCTGCNNDRVIVDKVTYRFSDPQPGDVVVFRGPDSWVNTEFVVDKPSNTFETVMAQLGSLIGLAPPDEKDFVKRVIAVGGQTVACCDSRNRVMVDGQPLDEPYLYYLPEAGPARQIPFGPVTVPQGELWVMGDSRNNSSDSRVDGHGPIPVENVIGKARMIVLPISRFGFIAQTDPQAQALGENAPPVTPLALGVLGALPLAVARRRRLRFAEASPDLADESFFLPTVRPAGPRRRRVG